jgi:hypothetical protein
VAVELLSEEEPLITSRSTLSVSAGLAVLAVVLAAWWISFGPRAEGGRDKQASTAALLSRQQRSALDAKGQPIRTIAAGPRSGSETHASLPPERGAVAPAPSVATPASVSSPPQPVNPGAPAEAKSPAGQADNASVSGVRTDMAANGASDPAATPGGSVDLNTASVEQLNALGAGMIGRRIIEFRPYASPEDLVTRRVLKRADYETIKAAVTAR